MISDRDLICLIGVATVGVLLLGGYGLDALEWLIDAIADLLGGDDD